MTKTLTGFGFAFAAAFCPFIAHGANTPRWFVVVAAALAMSIYSAIWLVKKIDITVAHLIGGAFVVWALITAAWSPAPETFDEVWKLILIALLFDVGSRIGDLRPVYAGCAAGIAISSALVVLDRAGLANDLWLRIWGVPYQQTGAPSGLFVNGIYLAEFAALVMVAYPRLWVLAVCAPSLVLVQPARGALLAAAVGGMVLLWRKHSRVAWIACGMCAAAIPGAIWMRPDSVIERIDTWADLLRSTTIFGRGLGSYFWLMPEISTKAEVHVRNLHANNDFLEILFETGVPGAVLAAAFVVALLWACRQTVKAPAFDAGNPGSSPGTPATFEELAVVAFLVEACFGFPLHMPATACIFAIAAGHLARRLPDWRDQPWARRVALFRGHAISRYSGLARSSDRSR